MLDAKVPRMNLNNDSVGLGFCDKLYVEEQLTPYMGNIAYRCRCLKRESKILKTKVDKGIVKILYNSSDGTLKWHVILHTNDIKVVLPDYVIE